MKGMKLFFTKLLPELSVKSNVKWLPGNVYLPFVEGNNTRNCENPLTKDEIQNEIYFLVKKENIKEYSNKKSFYNWVYDYDSDKIIYINGRLYCIIENLESTKTIVKVSPLYYLIFKSGISSIGRLYNPSKILQDVITFKVINLGYLPIHCGAVADDHGALVIFGPPNIGKSFTVLNLIKKGFYFLCEDACFLSNRGGNSIVYGNPYTLTISPIELINMFNLDRKISKISKLKFYLYYKVIRKIKLLDILSWYFFDPPIISYLEAFKNKIINNAKIKTLLLLNPRYGRKLIIENDKLKFLDILINLNDTEFLVYDSPLFRAYKYYTGKDISSIWRERSNITLSELLKDEKINLVISGGEINAEIIEKIIKIHRS